MKVKLIPFFKQDKAIIMAKVYKSKTELKNAVSELSSFMNIDSQPMYQLKINGEIKTKSSIDELVAYIHLYHLINSTEGSIYNLELSMV